MNYQIMYFLCEDTYLLLDVYPCKLLIKNVVQDISLLYPAPALK